MGFDAGPMKTRVLKKAAALEAEVIVAQYRIILCPLPAPSHTHTLIPTHMQPPLWCLQFCTVNPTVLKLIKTEMHVYCQ